MSQSTSQSTIANMAAIQTAIANQDSQELSRLLGSQRLEPLQKEYLLELADLGNDPQLKQIIQDAPEKS